MTTLSSEIAKRKNHMKSNRQMCYFYIQDSMLNIVLILILRLQTKQDLDIWDL